MENAAIVPLAARRSLSPLSWLMEASLLIPLVISAATSVNPNSGNSSNGERRSTTLCNPAVRLSSMVIPVILSTKARSLSGA